MVFLLTLIKGKFSMDGKCSFLISNSKTCFSLASKLFCKFEYFVVCKFVRRTIKNLAPPSANAALSPHPRLQTFYPPYAHSISYPSALPPPSLVPGYTSAPFAFSPPLTLSEFFNGMMEVFEPGALNYSTFFRPILSTLSAFRNPILTSFPLSGFLDSLLCALIVPTPGLAFSPPIPRTLAAALSFSSGRAYLFLNFLPPLFLRLIPTLIM